MRAWTRLVVAAAIGAAAPVFTVAPQSGALVRASRAAADEGWRPEFDDVCSRTQDAMTLTIDDLRRLVERCDRLRPSVERLEEPHRKVFSRRLQACRELYRYVLDSREAR
jgi:hypothetical protein